MQEGVFIGIASHATLSACWDDKVTPIITENQFPEWVDSPRYAADSGAWIYPQLDDPANWNCDDCAYHMNPNLSKPAGLRRVMAHYGLDADEPADRQRVIFWDDTPHNITEVQDELPETKAVLVPRHGDSGSDGGCGITEVEIQVAW